MGLELTFNRGRTAGGARCAEGRVRATIDGRDDIVHRVDFYADGDRVARDRHGPPFRRNVSRRDLDPGEVSEIRARIVTRDDRVVTRDERVRVCP